MDLLHKPCYNLDIHLQPNNTIADENFSPWKHALFNESILVCDDVNACAQYTDDNHLF